VKLLHYRAGQVLRVPGGRVSRISRQLTHEVGKGVSRMHQPPLPPRRYLWYHSVIARPEELSQWKIQMTPTGIEPATFRLTAQCLQELCHIVSWQFSKAGRICRNSWRHVQKFYLLCQQTDISIKLTKPMKQRRFVVAQLVEKSLRHLRHQKVREDLKISHIRNLSSATLIQVTHSHQLFWYIF
jgi:hypothetical protein